MFLCMRMCPFSFLIIHSFCFCHSGSDSDVMVSRYSVHLKRSDLRTLKCNAWLNDEAVNFFINTLAERAASPGWEREGCRIYTQSTFFYQQLSCHDKPPYYDYSGVKRWTRRFVSPPVFVVFNTHHTMQSGGHFCS